MNDPAIFLNFLDNIPQVRPARQEIVTFVETFEDLLSSSDDEIDPFVKEVHASNSARVSKAKLLIGSNVNLGLKSILFELKDRDVCGALPSAMVLNNLEAAQICTVEKAKEVSTNKSKLRKVVSLLLHRLLTIGTLHLLVW